MALANAVKPDLVIKKIVYDGYENELILKIKNKGYKTSKYATYIKVYDLDIGLEEAIEKKIPKKYHKFIIENTEDAKYYRSIGYAVTEFDRDPYFEKLFQIPPIKAKRNIYMYIDLTEYDHLYNPNCEIGFIIDPENEIKESNKKNNEFFYIRGG